MRGDEVVSLGWCFWHRSCFGCLFCKTKLPDPEDYGDGHNIAYNRRCDGSEDGTSTVIDGRTRRRRAGVELEEVPLCSVCKVETAGEVEDHVLEKGLKTMVRFDGGLGRDRLNRLDQESKGKSTEPALVTSRSPLGSRRLRGSRASEIERDLKLYIDSGSTDSNTRESATRNFPLMMTDGARSSGDLYSEDKASLLGNAAQMPGMSEGDFVNDAQIEYHNHSDNESAEFGQEQQPLGLDDDGSQDIYVSIFDPIGEPALRPSKTKPLPKWMRLLPNNVHKEREQQERRLAVRSEPVQSIQELETLRPNTPIAIEVSTSLPVDTTQPSTDATAPTSPATSPIDPVTPPTSMHIAKATPNPRISFGSADRRITDETHNNPQGVKLIINAPKPMKAPIHRMTHPSLHRSDNSPYCIHSIAIQPMTIHDSSVRCEEKRPPTPPLSAQKIADQISRNPPISTQTPTDPLPEIAAWTQRLESPIRPLRAFLHSSEYLERYQPVAVRGSWYQRYVPKAPEPILEKIRKQRGERGSKKRLEHEIGAETKQDGTGERIGGSVREAGSESHIEGFGGVDPRSNLHRELRNLFCED